MHSSVAVAVRMVVPVAAEDSVAVAVQDRILKIPIPLSL